VIRSDAFWACRSTAKAASTEDTSGATEPLFPRDLSAEVRSPDRHPLRQCPREDSNLRTWFRRPVLYPLSYGGPPFIVAIPPLSGAPYRRTIGRYDGPRLVGDGAQVKVLVADDDPVILRLIQVNLVLEGLQVETVTRGEDALTRAREGGPDVILLDVMMPGMTGWEVARRLKEDGDTSHIPVVFLSARTQEEDRRRGQELGVAAYVSKPFDPLELVDTVRRVAGRV
jgi:CheY-like chemotaxis protein